MNTPKTPQQDTAAPGSVQPAGSAFKALTALAFAATVAGVFTTLAGDWKADAAAWNIAAICLWLRSFPKGQDRPNIVAQRHD